MSIDRLAREIRLSGNPTALGLDTRIDYVPESFGKPYFNAGALPSDVVFAFNRALLEGLRDIIPCVKIQAACYELLGPDGMLCLKKTLEAARDLGYVTITDAKRGDIGTTASAYASAYIGENAQFPSDFVTVNPYLGTDGVAPFIDDCKITGRGIFVLVKTSNPSSGEFQDLRVADGRTLYEHVADKVVLWGSDQIGEEGYSSVGAVVGATYPIQGAALRRRMPHTFFLLPGYGAQGASASDLTGCFDSSGGGAIVNASRSLILAYKKSGSQEKDFVLAAREEALRMKDDLINAQKAKKNERD
jgi:orotidine-5'-phosphate decarboxylase